MRSIPMRSDWLFACFGHGVRKHDGQRITDMRAWSALATEHQVRALFSRRQVLRRSDANMLRSMFASEYLGDSDGCRCAGVVKVVRDDRNLRPATQTVLIDQFQDVPRLARVAVHRLENERMTRAISSWPTASEIASTSCFQPSLTVAAPPAKAVVSQQGTRRC